MRAYIHKLRAKSEDARKRILALSLAISMVLVGTVWIYGLGYRFGDHNSKTAESDIAPFALFGQSISSAYHNISASVGNISFTKDQAKQEPVQRQINVIPVEPTQ